MSILHVRQIRTAFNTRFAAQIDISDAAKKKPEEQEQLFLTRALAAYAVVFLAGADTAAAGACVTDQYGDNGIDAAYFDPVEDRLYLVQSKWVNNGTSGIESGDILKFTQGVRAVFDGEFASFGSKMKNRRAEMLAALDSASTRVILVVAHTSIQKLGGPSLKPITDLLAEFNDASEMASFTEITQADVHTSLTGTAEGAPIDLEVMLTEWGHVKEPFKAFYGQLSAADVGAWHTAHGDRLFSKNLRNVIGTSEINRTITDTAKSRPDAFWYFNNGITVLCQTISKKPLGGNSRDLGVFECHGVSVVNGAQTVGSLAAAVASQPEAVSGAKVMARFISLEHCPPDFAVDVTRATNMQNRVDNRDFAALDPNQDRLRKELLLDGRIYAYKTGEAPPPPDKGFAIDEATVALACSKQEVSLAVIAKNAIGRLWDNIDKPPYRLLFNAQLSGLRLWRLVEILRSIDESLKVQQVDRSGRERMVAVHGNRFIAHQVFSELDLAQLDNPDLTLAQARARASALVPSAIDATTSAIDSLFPSSYIQSLFKNASKCQQIHAHAAAVLSTAAQAI